MEDQGRNGGQEDIYSFKTDSPMGSDSSDPDSKVSRTAMASVKYKRKLWRNSTDDEDEVPCIKPCIVLLQRSKLCEAAWKKERENIGEKEASAELVTSNLIETQQQQNGHTEPPAKSPVSDSDFKCHVCQEKFSGRNLFMHHMRSKHGSTTTTVISARQPTPPPPPKGEFLRFYRHKGVWKLDARNLDCEVCGKALASPYKLKAHLEVEHGRSLYMGGPDAKSYSCPHCHRECESKFALDKHIFVKHSSSGQQIDQSQSSQSQKQSLNGAEPKLKVYECPYCFTLHANKDRFKKHLGFVPFVYSDCLVTVDSESMARQKDPVYCEVCGSKAANQAFLHAHQSSHAELPRPHECTNASCLKHFVFRCQLDRHLQLHQQKSAPVVTESPALKVKGKFRCTQCNKRTRTKGKLDTHVQTCHKTDSQEFRCDICNICLSSMKQISSHYAKKHEGVTPPAFVTADEPKESDCWALPDATFAPFPASQVRPESIGSSDSVSASDAFSMYFQSLQSLNLMDMDIPLDLEDETESGARIKRGNVTNNNEKILNPIDGTHREIIHKPANLAEFNKSCKDNELEFHTLQTVQNPEPSTTLLQTIPAMSDELPLLNQSENIMMDNLHSLCTLENSTINNFMVDETPVLANTQTCILNFNGAQSIAQPDEKVAIESQVLPLFTAQQLKYDPSLDLAIKQELEKNTKELQEICDSTSIGFISIPESAVVPTTVTPIPPPKVLRIEPTSANLDKIVQEIMMPTTATQPAPVVRQVVQITQTVLQVQQPPPLIKIEPISTTTTEEIKRKLAAKTKKKKELVEVEPAAPTIVRLMENPIKKDCKLCSKFFNSHEMLIKHCQQNCSGRTQAGADTTCQICGEKFGDRKLYLKHKKEEHPESLLTCSACNKTFFLMQSLARHQKQTCTNRVEYTCRKCKSLHDSLDTLRKHMQMVHPENVVCHICQKVLATSQSLKRHIKSHSKGGADLNPESPSKFDLSETMDSSDSSLKKLSLNQIDMNDDLSLNDLASWGTSNEIADSMNIDGESNFEEELMLFSSDTLTCEFCGSTFSSNKLLLKHLSTQHFPNTHWQPQTSSGSPAEENDLTERLLTSVQCNDS